MEIQGRCQKCESRWVVADKRWTPKEKCPFCGESLLRRDTIEGLLRSLVVEEGASVLKNSSRINGLLADYFPQEGQKRSAIRIALDMRLGDTFYTMANASEADVKERVASVRLRLKNEAWLSEEACDFICAAFLGALDRAEEAQFSVDDVLGAVVRQWMREPRQSGTETQTSGNRAAEMRESGQAAADLQASGRAALKNQAGLPSGQEVGSTTKAQQDFVAAANGDADAAFQVGYRFETGTGMPKNREAAMTWYEVAAKLGSPEAQNTLGYFYYKGRNGIAQNMKKAYHYFEQAASQGNAGSMRNLGVMYENGEYVQQDLVKAAEWYRQAAEKGNAEARADELRVQGRIYALYSEGPELTWEECLKAAALNEESKVYVSPQIPGKISRELLGCWREGREIWNEPVQAVLLYGGKGSYRAANHFDGILVTKHYLLHATKSDKPSLIEFGKVRDVRKREGGSAYDSREFISVIMEDRVIKTFLSSEWYHLEPLIKKLKQSGYQPAECQR